MLQMSLATNVEVIAELSEAALILPKDAVSLLGESAPSKSKLNVCMERPM